MPTKAQHSRHYEALRRRLREVRDNAGLTQRELGEILNKPQSWVYNCESGNRRMDIIEFARWAHACGVKPTTLLERFLKEARVLKK